MHMIRSIESDMTCGQGRDLRILLLSCDGEKGMIARRLAGPGVKVDVVSGSIIAWPEVICDLAGYRLLVIDCDGVGGLAAAQRAVQRVNRVPVILISCECREQQFPDDRAQPMVLRAPLSAVAIKVALDHVFPERIIAVAA